MDTEAVTQTLPAQRINPHQLLDEWLDKINARGLWTKTVSSDLSVECYRVGPSTMIITRFAKGWDIFTSSDSIMIPTTLRDAERRLQLDVPTMPTNVDVCCLHDDGQISMVYEDTYPRHLSPEGAEAVGLALLKAADRARDPRNQT